MPTIVSATDGLMPSRGEVRGPRSSVAGRRTPTFTRTTASSAAPEASIGTATNWAAPAKTSTDIAHTSSGRRPACTARPPNTVPYTKTDGTRAAEATRPSRKRVDGSPGTGAV
jgi:hypothetical protein